MRRGGDRQIEPAGRLPHRLRDRQRGGRPDHRRPARPFHRLRVRTRRAGPRPDPADGAAGGGRPRFLRHQGAPARCPAQPGDLRGRAPAPGAGAVRRGRARSARWSCSPARTPTWTSSFRTWAASPTTGPRRPRSARCWPNGPTSTPTPPGYAGSTCWSGRCGGPGPDKVLFGSDGPWLHPGLELAKVRLLRLPPGAEALVLGGNFLRLTRRARLRHRRAAAAAGAGHRSAALPAAGRRPRGQAPHSPPPPARRP